MLENVRAGLKKRLFFKIPKSMKSIFKFINRTPMPGRPVTYAC